MLILFVRTITLYLLVLVVMRLMGKRQIGQLQPFELAVTILIADLVAIPMQDRGLALINGIIPVLTLLIAQTIYLARLKLRSLICGKPTIMGKTGRLTGKTAKPLFLDDLRNNSGRRAFDLQEVGRFETNGLLSC